MSLAGLAGLAGLGVTSLGGALEVVRERIRSQGVGQFRRHPDQGQARPAPPARSERGSPAQQFLEHLGRFVRDRVPLRGRLAGRCQQPGAEGLVGQAPGQRFFDGPGVGGLKRASRGRISWSEELSPAIVGAPHAIDSTTGKPYPS